jgi:pimeloyl-ACP methyl ester carboxylesterase
MRQNDLRGKLSQIEVPALVIWGMEDNTVPLKDASALVEEWPDADLRIIPQASHWPHFETPQVTQRYIEGFLGRPLKLFNLHTQLLSHV